MLFVPTRNNTVMAKWWAKKLARPEFLNFSSQFLGSGAAQVEVQRNPTYRSSCVGLRLAPAPNYAIFHQLSQHAHLQNLIQVKIKLIVPIDTFIFKPYFFEQRIIMERLVSGDSL